MTLLKFLWPFIWEVVLGKQTFIEAVQTNKRKLGIFFLIIGLIFTNTWTLSRFIPVAKEYSRLKKECTAPFVVTSTKDTQPKVELPKHPPSQVPTEDSSDQAVKDQLMQALTHINRTEH